MKTLNEAIAEDNKEYNDNLEKAINEPDHGNHCTKCGELILEGEIGQCEECAK